MKTNIDEGRIVKALAGFYYIDDGHEVHQCRARGKFRKQDIKPVVGDFVEFQKGNHDDGYLLKILERKNVLRRPPIANIDQALLVFSRKEPDFSTVLLDKFLLLIEHYHIKPIIVISKMDIEGDDSIYQYIQEYRNAGYTVIETSSKQNKGINEIKEIFKDQVTVITGQSGVGKSTLLNVLGGLDRVDSGEIIINGKSSKDFSQSDFDSYRNTYLGFIFQEYNILNEFSIAENIALAIELQGRKPTNEEIDNILNQVDLAGLAKRKPNELSGGQKQRVAIARALIKNPQIIMADEPTGALDSKTGKQIFDTLKALSHDKLVLIVSHDREFAEQYADRIIELKDGKVISDVEKTIIQTQNQEGINIIDNKIIKIDKDYILKDEDFLKIKDYIKTAKSDVIISVDNQNNEKIKTIMNLSDEGLCKFIDTNQDKIVIQDENYKTIKSKLGFKKAFKMGASSLKIKKFRECC